MLEVYEAITGAPDEYLNKLKKNELPAEIAEWLMNRRESEIRRAKKEKRR